MAVARTGTSRLAWLRSRMASDWPVVAWLLFAATINYAGARSVPGSYHQATALTDIPAGDRAAMVRSLANLNLSPAFIAWFEIATTVISLVINTAIAWLLIRKTPRTGFMIYLAFIILAMSNANYPPAIDDVLPGMPVEQFIVRFATAVGITGFFTLPFIFPDGCFVPRWTMLWMLYMAADVFNFAFHPSFAAGSRIWAMIDTITTVLLIISLIYAVIFRYRRVSTPGQQRQTKWAAFGLAIGVPGFFAGDAMMRNIDATPFGVACLLGFLVIMPIASTLPFVTIGIAIINHHLYDIDVILNRSLVWLAMTLTVIGAYMGIVIGIGSLVSPGRSLFLSLIATGIVAVAFQPMRDRVQRGVNRLLYGDRDDPYAVLTRLGQRVEAALTHDDVLPAIVRTLTEALRLPYAAIALRDGSALVPAAVSGTPVVGVTRVPLIYQNEAVGELIVAPRSPGELFGPADRRLLEDLARQIGVAAHAARLTTDLQRSRQRIRSVLEEERRRLRRDLHDGLGTQLAALSIQTSALRALVPTDPAMAEHMAADIRDELKAAVGDIRRLVHGLRPPALDELGLVGALRQRAVRFGAGGLYQTDDGSQTGNPHLTVTIIAPDEIPALPAAVEVAAYRIADEAIANVARHAGAKNCVVRLGASDTLELVVEDDGQGIPEQHTGGVGLLSMRERAAELGGTLAISAVANGRGTRIEARLPIVQHPESSQ
jgi:signal transduction histidine kinase